MDDGHTISPKDDRPNDGGDEERAAPDEETTPPESTEGSPETSAQGRKRDEARKGSGPALRPVKPTTVSAQVAAQLRELIASGEIRPGERIPSERDLADQLGAGRSAVREALRELKAQGTLVSGRGGQGTRVAAAAMVRVRESLGSLLGSGAEHVRELMELRSAVEIHAAGLAARRATLEDLRELSASFGSPDPSDPAGDDVALHSAIAGATHNALFRHMERDLVGLLHEHTEAVLDVLYRQPGGDIAIRRQHEAVVGAIRRGDESAARESMRYHLEYVTRGLAELTGVGPPIRLVIADLDGTVLSGPRHISDRTRNAISAVREVGAEVVLASARPPRSMRPYHQELRLTTPVIACNGALLWNLLAGTPVEQAPLDHDLAREMVEIGRGLGVIANLESNDKWYADEVTERVLESIERYGTLAPPEVGAVDEVLDSEDYVEKVILDLRDLNDEAEADAARASIRGTFGGRSHIYETVPGLIDLVSLDASKATMAQRLTRLLDIPAEQVLAVGDNENDVELLRWAGTGVAMGNAVTEAKEVADVVTASNRRDGVAEALERWVLEQPQDQAPF